MISLILNGLLDQVLSCELCFEGLFCFLDCFHKAKGLWKGTA